MLPVDKRALQGVWLLLVPLTVFFVSGILLYVVYIALRLNPTRGSTHELLTLPYTFIPSTLFLLGVSGFLELACRAAKRDQSSLVPNYVILALFCGFFFMVVQAEGMYRLVASMHQNVSHGVTAYAFTFVLALLHALHVVVGLVGMVLTAGSAIRNRYDHERMFGLQFCTLYWHFLDIVWLVLLAAFYIAGWMLRH